MPMMGRIKQEMRCIQYLSNLKGQILRVQWQANVIDLIVQLWLQLRKELIT